MMTWLLAFITRWRAARRAAHLIRIQRTVSKGLSDDRVTVVPHPAATVVQNMSFLQITHGSGGSS